MRFINQILLLVFIVSAVKGQTISEKEFSNTIIHEDFDLASSEYFRLEKNDNNNFEIDNSDLLLVRKSINSSYLINVKHTELSDFILKTSVRIGPSNNKEASIGIILKAQQDGKGSVIFEINKKREYRIKQLLGNSHQVLSGNAKHEGWTKSKLVNGINKHNFIEIRTEKNIYDVYVNSKYLTTFFVPEFTYGSCGIIISPETKARISYYYINTKGERNPVATYTNDLNKTKKSSSTETNRLTAVVKTLRSKVSKLQTANTNLSADLSNVTSASVTLSAELKKTNKEVASLRTTQNAHNKVTSDLNTQITNLNAKIEALNAQLTTAKNTNSEFETTNAELKELFIQKDFELNGVKPSEMIKQTTTYTVQPKVLKGNNTVYSVQLGMFMQTKSQSAFKDLNSVWYQSNDNGTYQYLSGEFSSPKEVANHKSEINAKGYKNAFIVTITK